MLIKRLECPGHVCGNLGQETSVGVTIGIDRLLVPGEFAQWNFAEDTQPLHGMAAEQTTRLGSVSPIRRRFHGEDANCMDILVRIQAGVSSLVSPVAKSQVVGHLRLVTCPGGRYTSRGNLAVRVGLAFIVARCTNQPEWRAFRKVW